MEHPQMTPTAYSIELYRYKYTVGLQHTTSRQETQISFYANGPCRSSSHKIQLAVDFIINALEAYPSGIVCVTVWEVFFFLKKKIIIIIIIIFLNYFDIFVLKIIFKK